MTTKSTSFEEVFLGQEAACILAADRDKGKRLTPEQRASLELESRIAGAFVLYSCARAIKDRRQTWSRFRRPCAQRSPAQIGRMERARGLRA